MRRAVVSLANPLDINTYSSVNTVVSLANPLEITVKGLIPRYVGSKARGVFKEESSVKICSANLFTF